MKGLPVERGLIVTAILLYCLASVCMAAKLCDVDTVHCVGSPYATSLCECSFSSRTLSFYELAVVNEHSDNEGWLWLRLAFIIWVLWHPVFVSASVFVFSLSYLAVSCLMSCIILVLSHIYSYPLAWNVSTSCILIHGYEPLHYSLLTEHYNPKCKFWNLSIMSNNLHIMQDYEQCVSLLNFRVNISMTTVSTGMSTSTREPEPEPEPELAVLPSTLSLVGTRQSWFFRLRF